VFRIYDAPAYFPALVTAPRWAGVGFCSSFRFARVREDRAARVPPVIRGSARLIRLPPPIGFRSFPPVPFILTSCVALSFPLAVRSLPPLAVAPWPPTDVIRPALSRVRRFVPLLTILVAGLALRLLPVELNRPLLSRLYCLAIATSVLPQVSGNLQQTHARAMPITVPPVLSPWRSGDRELIRQYANWPSSGYNLTQLTAAMNRVAETSVDTVTAIQGWIDKAESLDQDWTDKIEDGTAHLGNAAEYEGPIPGQTLTANDYRSKLDVIEFDTSLRKVRTVTGGRSDATAGGLVLGKIAALKADILQALGIQAANGGGMVRLVRS
jgi:hypothetical protein